MSKRGGGKMALPRPAVGESMLLTKDNNKVAINYFVSGSGETVVLLPAFARAAGDYNELVVSLNEAGYRTVAINQRGMGNSKSPFFDRPRLHDFAADVADVVRALDDLPGGKVHIIGRAFGARVTRAFAGDYPALVQSVILLAGGGSIPLKKSQLLKYILSNSRLIPEWLRIRVVGATLYAPRSKVPPELAYRHSFRAARKQVYGLRTPLELWPGGDKPVLWVLGGNDPLTPVPDDQAWRDRFPEQVKVVVIPDAAHGLLTEQPDAVMKEIMTFLREHPMSANSG